MICVMKQAHHWSPVTVGVISRGWLHVSGCSAGGKPVLIKEATSSPLISSSNFAWWCRAICMSWTLVRNMSPSVRAHATPFCIQMALFGFFPSCVGKNGKRDRLTINFPTSIRHVYFGQYEKQALTFSRDRRRVQRSCRRRRILTLRRP